MGNFTVEEKKPSYGAKIKVVGVGGGGGNIAGKSQHAEKSSDFCMFHNNLTFDKFLDVHF